MLRDFSKDTAKGGELPGCCAEGDVLSFGGAEGDLRLELAAPLNGATIVDDDISSTRKDTVSKVREFFVPGTSEVGINEHVESAGGVRCVDEAFVCGVSKVAAYSFNSLFMELSGFVGKSGAVVHGHADVRTGHLCQEVELANYGTIVPRLFSLVTVVVGMEDMNRWGGFGMRGGKAQVI